MWSAWQPPAFFIPALSQHQRSIPIFLVNLALPIMDAKPTSQEVA
jgi:hypothetical protein